MRTTHGDHANAPRRVTQAAELHARGLTLRQICARMRLHKSTVTSMLASYRFYQRVNSDSPGQHALTTAARARIASEVAAGVRCPRCFLILPCDHPAPIERKAPTQ